MRNSFVLAALCAMTVYAANEPLSESKEQRDARMQWFRDARFGMFVHWGLYAVPAGEWNSNKGYGEWFLEETKIPVSRYEQFANQFNPVKFDAREWVRMAKSAGMKYVVITSKHHDGFGMWPSKQGTWNIGSTRFKRDPLKELADACKTDGIVFCFYHSIMDWHHPDYTDRRGYNDRATGTPDMDKYVAYMKGQLKELLTGYGRIGILWFDGEWEGSWNHERGVDLYNYVRGLQPSIIVNNRVGKGRAGMSGMNNGQGVGDYGTPEQEIPPNGFGPGVDWESCMTMNGHWGYNKNDQGWKSTTTLIQNLINCASKGGNYLLNIGPTAEGTFPQPCIERLAEIGAWMKVNGEAIHGTQASPFPREFAWGKCTQKPGVLYLFVEAMPTDRQIELRGMKSKVNKASLLADPSHAPLPVSTGGGGVRISLANVAADNIDPHATVVRVEVVGAVEAEPFAVTAGADGTFVLAASDATLHGSGIAVEQKWGAPSIGCWLNKDDYVEWPLVAGKAGTYDVVAEVACQKGSEGSVLVVEAAVEAKQGGGQTSSKAAIEFTMPATGDWSAFEQKTLGRLGFGPGKGAVTVKARTKPGEAVGNIRRIVLKPVSCARPHVDDARRAAKGAWASCPQCSVLTSAVRGTNCWGVMASDSAVITRAAQVVSGTFLVVDVSAGQQ